MSDLISRRDAIEAIDKLTNICVNNLPMLIYKTDVQDAINELPSVHPDRKTGWWVEMGKNKDGTHNLCCGVCGKFKFKSKGHANSDYTKNKYKFCGGCGCKMM